MYLILRPKAKLADSVACFQGAGLSAFGCGLIDTVALPGAAAILPALFEFNPDLVVVTSTVAADLYISALTHSQTSNLIFIAVGASTAKRLSSSHTQVVQARPSNSEGILACISHLKIKNPKVAILKGKGGRNLIIDTLSANGIAVKEFDLYERILLKAPYYTAHFETNDIQCIIATSTEIIDAAYNFFEHDWLNKCQWIVVSKRLKKHLSALGAKHIFTSNGATDSHLIAAANQVKGTQHE
jgi:uroporphyrinogen-III synthase